MNDKYNVGIYLRLSKEDEKLGESGSIGNQRLILIDYIERNNLNLVTEYIDDGVSGTTFDRVGFKRMIRDIEDKKINMVITKDTSRLGRDHIEFGYYVEKYFPENNVRYVAVCDNVDTFGNNNDMLLFKSAYNDLYVRDISNKIRASLNIKKRNGEFVGAYAPYGYKKDENDKHKLVIDREAADVVNRIFNLFVAGNSVTAIAKILTEEEVPIPSIQKNMNRGVKSTLFGIWNTRTITDIITNPTYIGNLTQGRSKKINYKSKKRIHTKKSDWIVTINTCPKIIDEKIFNLANNIYNSNKNKYKNKENCLLLRGLVYCKECNHKIGFRTINNKKDKTYGSCNYYLKHRIYNVCTPHNIKYNILEEFVLREIRGLITQIKLGNWSVLLENVKKEVFVSDRQLEIKGIVREISMIEMKLERLYDDRLSGIITKDMYLKKHDNLVNKREKLNIRKNELLSSYDKDIDIHDKFEMFLNSLEFDRRFISSIIKKITYSENGDINIYFNIKKM